MSTKKDNFSVKDKFYMELALDLAKARQGHTGTNPSVGCLIVKNDKIISIGQTSINGRPHAELNAIKNCPENLNGSTMYVTLEPCCHYGKTAPCTSSIIKSKIAKVIYSVKDIDKRVNGKSKKILTEKKIITKSGLLNHKIKQFYLPYFYNKTKELPYVTGKIAISKNNLIYSKSHKRITNKHSDKLTHLLRYKNDSIMITSKTANIDNPKLNCRLKKLKFIPKRIILDKQLNLNNSSYLFKTAMKDKTVVFYNKADKKKINKFKKNKIDLIKTKIYKNRKFVIINILKKLYKLGLRNILIEGGDELTKYLIKNKLFNQFYLFKSPKILSKTTKYKEFTSLKSLKKNYKYNEILKSNFGKDLVTLYKK